MGKRGPKPKIERAKRGRKKGFRYNQSKTVDANNDVAFGEKPRINFDTLAAYEIAHAYIVNYKLKPIHAARLGVCIQYANYVYSQQVFSAVVIKAPYSGITQTLTAEKQKEFQQDFDDSFSLSPRAKEKQIMPRQVGKYNLLHDLPNPKDVVVWIDKTHPLVRRVLARIYRHNKEKSKG